MQNRGYLRVPKDAKILTIEDNEFGRSYTVKNSDTIFLYTTPPTSKMTAALRSKQYSTTEPENGIGLIHAKDGEQIGSYFRKLNPGEELLARKLPEYPGILEVATYKKAKTQRTNSHEENLGIQIIARGFVEARHLKVGNQKFVKENGNLFKNRFNGDLISDVRQNTFGDCFLLATIVAILHRHGSHYIRSMMVQDGDYTVVRLYDPVTLAPVYIRVKNSYYYENGVCAVKHEALWVHILEKAYTALGCVKELDDDHISHTFLAFREMFGDGGDPLLAMKIFTGEMTEEYIIKDDNAYPWQIEELKQCTPLYFQLSPLLEKISTDGSAAFDAFLKQHADSEIPESLIQILDQNLSAKAPAVFFNNFIAAIANTEKNGNLSILFAKLRDECANDSEMLLLINAISTFIRKFISMRIEAPSILSKLFPTTKQLYEIGPYAHALATHPEYDTIIDNEKKISSLEEALNHIQNLRKIPPGLPPEYWQTMTNFINDTNQANNQSSSPDKPSVCFNSEPGVGIHNAETEALYAHLNSLYNNPDTNCIMVATTRYGLKKTGLCENHVYTITGIHKSRGGNGEYMVSLRNPWKTYGLEYVSEHQRLLDEALNRPLTYESKSGEFSITIGDLMRYFSRITVGYFTKPDMKTIEVSKQQTEACNQQKEEQSFFKRHWGKILFFTLATTATVVAGIFTFGIVPLLALTVTGLLAMAGLSVTSATATIIGIGAAATIGFMLGSLFGCVIGGLRDCLCRQPQAQSEEAQPLLAAENATTTKVYQQLDMKASRSNDRKKHCRSKTQTTKPQPLQQPSIASTNVNTNIAPAQFDTIPEKPGCAPAPT